MPFALSGLLPTFYFGLKEPVPSSATDTTSSRVPIPAFLSNLNYCIQKLNTMQVYVQCAVIAVTPGQRQYALPADFIRETSVKYRGIPLAPTTSSDALFLSNIGNWFPFQYTIIYPGTSASSVPPTGQPYLILDPPPSENSAQIEPNPPPFPSFNDPYVAVFYNAMIPADFTVSNYTSYVFNLPALFQAIFVDLSLAFVARSEGKMDVWNAALQESIANIKEINSYARKIRERFKPQTSQVWFEYE